MYKFPLLYAGYEPSDKSVQIEIVHFLSHFLSAESLKPDVTHRTTATSLGCHAQDPLSALCRVTDLYLIAEVLLSSITHATPTTLKAMECPWIRESGCFSRA
jgi:hypothetical protein